MEKISDTEFLKLQLQNLKTELHNIERKMEIDNAENNGKRNVLIKNIDRIEAQLN